MTDDPSETNRDKPRDADQPPLPIDDTEPNEPGDGAEELLPEEVFSIEDSAEPTAAGHSLDNTNSADSPTPNFSSDSFASPESNVFAEPLALQGSSESSNSSVLSEPDLDSAESSPTGPTDGESIPAQYAVSDDSFEDDSATSASTVPAAVTTGHVAGNSGESTKARRRSWKRLAGVAVVWLLIAAAVYAALIAGLRLRHWTFVQTAPIRFSSDIDRGWAWGFYNFQNGHERGRGYFETYDDVGIQNRRANMWIDYAPLRLATMTMWAAWNHGEYPYQKRQQHLNRDPTKDEEFQFHKFVLNFNSTMASVGAVGIFMLIRFVVRRSRTGGLDEPYDHSLHARQSINLESGLLEVSNRNINEFTGVWSGLIGAALFWFSPAVILSSHGWPTWDMWVVPPFVWAVYQACRGRWMTAGVIIACGAMFKGQQFIAVPVLILWPVFQGRFTTALRFLGGFLIGFGTLALPWELFRQNEMGYREVVLPALFFVLGVLLTAGVLPLLRRLIITKLGQLRVPPWGVLSLLALLAWGLVAWPTLNYAPPGPATWVCLTIAFLSAAAVSIVPRRQYPAVAAVAVGGAILACTSIFSLSDAWFDASFRFGTNHWERGMMMMGNTDNLPAILSKRYGWRDPLETAFTIGTGESATPVTMKTLLFGIFTVLLVFASAGIAMQHRRRSTRFLVAIVAPFLLFFTFPAQIHERYLLFAAGVAACCIGHSVGMMLIAVLLNVITWCMTMHVMLAATRGRGFGESLWPGFRYDLQEILNATFPDLGWAVLLTAFIVLWIAITPIWRTRDGRELIK